MNRFFSYTAGYSGLEVYPTEEEARANFETCFEAVIDRTPHHLQDELGDWCWGELRGVIRSREVVALNARPDSEVESLRAALVELRSCVAEADREFDRLARSHARARREGHYEAYSCARKILRHAINAPLIERHENFSELAAAAANHWNLNNTEDEPPVEWSACEPMALDAPGGEK